MKKLFLWMLIAAFAFVGCSDDNDPIDEGGEDIIYELKLPTYPAGTENVGDTENPVSTWDVDFGGGYIATYYQTLLTDESKHFTFDCVTASWGGIAAGYGFSNLTSGDSSAFPKRGVNNSTYVTSYYDSYSDKDLAVRFTDENGEAQSYRIEGIYITNAYTAVDVIENGSAITPTDEFKDGDWFKLTIYNLAKTKSVEYYLADFRNGKKEIIKEWKWVELASLGETNGLKFELSSSDVGDWGMNTPSYFCLDGIKLIE